MARNQFSTASQGEVTETQNTDCKYESPLTILILMKKPKSRLQVSLFLCSLMISISGLRDLGAQDQIPLNNNSGRPIDALASGQTGQPKPLPTEPLEKYDNPPAPFPLLPTAVSPGMVSQYDSFTSYQVNVDANGMNILGDAANEPSIAVDPTNPSKIAIQQQGSKSNHIQLFIF